MPKAIPSSIRRERWLVTGQVQGVGFRPFVYREAHALGATGFVSNDRHGATVEVQGASHQLDALHRRLVHESPALIRIAALRRQSVPTIDQETAFVIAPSDARDDAPSCEVTIDTAVCPDCRAELFDPANRRWGHALINCTNCGPRYTIIHDLPYDRPNTTMAAFAMCPACRHEYDSPADRRFHAQPTNCRRCGPQLALLDPKGQSIACDPIAQTRELLKSGRIVAMKGIGGFHLAVRADEFTCVDRLRQLKHRSRKPFAVMVATLEHASRLVQLSDHGIEAIISPAAPIVLAAKRSSEIVDAVAPGMGRLGVMLPYSPIQHLIFADPDMPPLVMTSANDSDEPLVYTNADAIERVSNLCDAILLHDRDIARPVDDSVVIDVADEPPILLRRARGYVPASIELPWKTDEPGLCIGGDLKGAIAVVQERRVILSQHLGDLAHPSTFALLDRTVRDLTTLFRIRPRWVACDLHPGYVGTRYAREYAARERVPLIQVQHHHAHAAGVLAEHGVTERSLAIVCDGTGYGTDGTTWGGELLLVDGARSTRLASLVPLPLAGGDAASRDARRPALAMLRQALGPGWSDSDIAKRLVPIETDRQILAAMIDGPVNCTFSSGAGRLFDGMAAILGVANQNTFESECAMRLESHAHRATGRGIPRPVHLSPGAEHRSRSTATCGTRDVIRVELSELVRDIIDRLGKGEAIETLALDFHLGFADAWADLANELASEQGVTIVGLSGGVFCNTIVSKRVTQRLAERGLRALRHERVSPNDGGLAYGQAAVATRLRQR